MARRDKVRLPSSGAGITQYFDEVTSKYEIQPMHVVFIAIGAIVLVLLLGMM
jgi:preprotein translocase subunit Sec61beta